MSGYVCYTLCSANGRCTYVGITNCLARRLRQHNGELSGGAKYTASRGPWTVACVVSGFRTKIEALQFEWALHHARLKEKQWGLAGRWKKLVLVCSRDRWTRSSPPACDVALTITLYVEAELSPLPGHVVVVKNKE